MDGANGEQDSQPAPEARYRGVAAARELYAESDAEQQREDRIELAFDEEAFQDRHHPIPAGGRERRCLFRGEHEQARRTP